jgi:hypothetical protein
MSDGEDSGEYESPDEEGPEELEIEMFHYVVKHVIDLKDEEMFQAFIENIPDIMTLKFFSPEEFEELWLKKELKKIPIKIKMNIRAWKIWLMKNPEDELKFDKMILHKELIARAHKLNEMNPSSNAAKLDQPKSFDGVTKHWKQWKRTILTYYLLKTTPQGLPYAYVLAGVNRKADAENTDDIVNHHGSNLIDPAENNRHMKHCRALRSLPAYIDDKRNLFLELKMLCCKNAVWQKIRNYEKEYDARGAWKALLNAYEGDAITQMMINRANNTYMHTILDGNSKMDLDKYILKYDEAYTDLMEEGSPVSELQKISFFLSNLQDKRYIHIVENAKNQSGNRATGYRKFEDVTAWLRNRAVEAGLINDHATRHSAANQRHIQAVVNQYDSDDDADRKPKAKNNNNNNKKRDHGEMSTKHRSKEEWYKLDKKVRDEVISMRKGKKPNKKSNNRTGKF